MRKSISILLFFLVSFSKAQNEKYYSPFKSPLFEGTTYAFGDDIKIRDTPSLNSKVLGLIKIGESITILEQTDSVLNYNGIDHNWYKISYKGVVGYTIGGLFATEKLQVGVNNFLFNFRKIEAHDYSLLIRVQTYNSFKEYEFKLSTAEYELEVRDGGGLKGVESIVKVNYFAEACGVNGGVLYLFYDGEEIIETFTANRIFDADIYYWSEDIVFPSDTTDLVNQIYYVSESMTTEDEISNWTETRIVKRLLDWSEGQVFPDIYND